jgi:hypothetical protein
LVVSLLPEETWSGQGELDKITVDNTYEAELIHEMSGNFEFDARTVTVKRGVRKRLKNLASLVQETTKEIVPKVRRYRVLEIFTWCMALTTMAFNRNWDTMEPVDALNGWDLRAAQVRKAAYDYVDRESPHLVVIAWPCTNFSTIQNLNR